ncbi:hypothetical protein SDC9_99995 [bioreactor metagenome]|uniref:Uncharacterized protein n=1 Tax=bioreactor metagenome TaxID=1076179 RepID=A0A645AJC0_9ZZZZ
MNNEKSDNTINEELKNLEKNYVYAEGYLNNNASNMPKEDIKNLKEKQENRKEKINELKFQ